MKYLITGDYTGFLSLLISLVIVYILNSSSTWLQNYWMIAIAQQTVYTMRTELFRHLQRLPISFFDKRQHGEVMSRVTNDIENISYNVK